MIEHWWQAVLLAILQGLTEFLPISSSGHLAIAEELMGINLDNEITFVVVVHFGTLLAVLAYYWSDWVEIFGPCFRRDEQGGRSRWLLWLLAIGTVPAALLGLLVEGWVEQAFDWMALIGVFWLITAALMWYADRLGGRKDAQQMRTVDAVWIGIAQALAIFPGISRSGATIFGGLARGLNQAESPKFAFLLSVPIILGGTVKKALDLKTNPLPSDQWLIYLVACLVAGVVGYFSIRLVIGAVRAAKLKYFAGWCLLVGVAAILWGLLKH